MTALHFVLKFVFDPNLDKVRNLFSINRSPAFDYVVNKEVNNIINNILLNYDEVATGVTGFFTENNIVGHIYAIPDDYDNPRKILKEEIYNIRNDKHKFIINIEELPFPLQMTVTFEVIGVFIVNENQVDLTAL